MSIRFTAIWASAIAGLFVFTACSPEPADTSATDTATVEESVDAEVVREVKFSVPAVTCASCLAKIRGEVIKEPGVVSMGGDPKAKTMVLRLSADAPQDDAHLTAAIKRAGFDATIQ